MYVCVEYMYMCVCVYVCVCVCMRTACVKFVFWNFFMMGFEVKQEKRAPFLLLCARTLTHVQTHFLFLF